MFRFVENYETGSEKDSAQITEIRDDVNAMLQATGKPGIDQTTIGQLVRKVFGPSVHRKKSKSEGRSVYKYFGLKRKLPTLGERSHLTERPSQESSPQTNPSAAVESSDVQVLTLRE